MSGVAFLSALPRESLEQLSRACMVWAASKREDDSDALFIIEQANKDHETVPPITLAEVRRYSGGFPFGMD